MAMQMPTILMQMIVCKMTIIMMVMVMMVMMTVMMVMMMMLTMITMMMSLIIIIIIIIIILILMVMVMVMAMMKCHVDMASAIDDTVAAAGTTRQKRHWNCYHPTCCIMAPARNQHPRNTKRPIAMAYHGVIPPKPIAIPEPCSLPSCEDNFRKLPEPQLPRILQLLLLPNRA